jgi:hypothetical protein
MSQVIGLEEEGVAVVAFRRSVVGPGSPEASWLRIESGRNLSSKVSQNSASDSTFCVANGNPGVMVCLILGLPAVLELLPPPPPLPTGLATESLARGGTLLCAGQVAGLAISATSLARVEMSSPVEVQWTPR